MWFERRDKRGEKGLEKKGRKQGGISVASDFIVCKGERAFSALDNSDSEKCPVDILLEKQSKMPPYTKILRGQPWPKRSQLISLYPMTENHSWGCLNSLKWHGPIRKFCGNGETILALAFQSQRKLISLLLGQNPHPHGRDRKSRCSFRDSSECWLGFYRHFSHSKNAHYKNCKIKGKLQICCWVFITELIKTQTKQKLRYKSFSTSWKTEQCTGVPLLWVWDAWLTSSLGHRCYWRKRFKVYIVRNHFHNILYHR